jgi:hypothetical protein
MAYKQSPGRGNNAKTGHGIPSPFKQEEPKTTKMKAQIAKKEAAGATYAETKSAEKFANKAPGTGLVSGTETNIKSGKTQPKGYEKSLKSGKELGLQNAPNDMFITDSAGKVIKKAEARNPKAVEALKKEFTSAKSSTEDARKANSAAQNYRLKIAGK